MYHLTKRLLRDLSPNAHLLTVCVWKILIPFLLLTAWHLIPIFLRRDAATPGTPGNEDLLVFSAFVLIEGGLKLRGAGLRHGDLLLRLAVLVFILFGVTTFISAPDAARARALIYFNYAIALCSIAGSLYVFSLVSRAASQRKLEVISRPSGSVVSDSGSW